MPAGISFRGIPQFDQGLATMVERVDAATPIGLTEGGRAFADAARSRAPKQSGRLAGSIQASAPQRVGAGVWAVRVRPNTPYAKRIEQGYTGPDALGRTYNQGAEPYMTPARMELAPVLPSILARGWRLGIA